MVGLGLEGWKVGKGGNDRALINYDLFGLSSLFYIKYKILIIINEN